MQFQFHWTVLFFITAAAALSLDFGPGLPLGGYAPGNTSCPSESSLLRLGNSTSQAEKDWVSEREKITRAALDEFLKKHLPENDPSFPGSRKENSTESAGSRLAIGFSGGGYRAMFVGAGELAALDSRDSSNSQNGLNSTKNQNSSESSSVSPLAGLLQASTYSAGLLGGLWLLGLVAVQNWPTISEILGSDEPGLWNVTRENSIVDTSKFFSLAWSVVTANYNSLITHLRHWGGLDGIGAEVESKSKNFFTTLTDYWGRSLAHQFFPSEENYLAPRTWLDLADSPAFKNHSMPFPLVSALARHPDSLVYDINSPVVEFTPLEMGLFDSSINSFFPSRYLGTEVDNGEVVGECVAGFDNAAFVIGTSSSLFNQWLDTLVCPDCDLLPGIVKWFVRKLLQRMSKQQEDIAIYNPNPFYGSEYAGSSNLSSSESLFLMDGGLGGEYIPLSLVMNTQRQVDTVLAFDNNPASWPDGLSLVNAFRKSQTYEGRSSICPWVPGEDTFAAKNFTARPVFFGCDAKNQTDLAKNGVVPPLVIYLANRPFEFYTNQSTLQLTWPDDEMKATIQNGFDIASQMNGTVDAQWGTCVACAVVRRDQERQGLEQSEECKRCFKRYCWDGSVYEGDTYYRPVNYTIDGLTNSSMSLWGDNRIVVNTALSGGLWSILLGAVKSIFLWF